MGLKGRTPDGPIPGWLVEAHDNYRLAQAAPGWDPTSELSDFQLLVLPEIHEVYQSAQTELEDERAKRSNGV